MSDPHSANVLFERSRGVHSLHVTHGLAHVVVPLSEIASRSTQILSLFGTLAAVGVSVSLTKLHSKAVTMAVGAGSLDTVEEALTRRGLRPHMRRNLSIVSVGAASMRELYGVMVEIADALSAAGATLYEMGDSHNSVLCLIDSVAVPGVVDALRSQFGLGAHLVTEVAQETA